MYHYFEALTNTSGAALVGYFVRVIDTGTGGVVTLASDANGTPIVTVSGQANMAKTDSDGNLSFYIEPGTYHLDIYSTDATTFIRRVSNVGMMTGPTGDTGAKGDPGDKGDTGDKGDKGDPGADGSASNYLSGPTPPSSNDGVSGDIWEDTSAGVVYGPKTSGSWGAGRKYTGTVAASKLTWTDLNGTLPSWLTISRAQGSTDAFYDDAPGRAYNTVSANQPVFWHGGLWRGGSSKNWLLNSTAPATQTVTLAVGKYALYGNGTGTLTSSAGTAVGSGFGALALSGQTYQLITITTSGTVTITKSGTVNWFQLANDAGDTTKPSLGPLIVTTAAAAAVDAHIPVVGSGALKTALQSGTFSFALETLGIQPRTSGQLRFISQNNNAQLDYNLSNGHVSVWDGISGSIPETAIGEASPNSLVARTRWAMAFSGSTGSIGGGSHVPIAAPFAWPSGTTIVLGGANGTLDTDPLNGAITRIGYSASRLSDVDLTAEYTGYGLDTSTTKLPVWQAAKRTVLAGTADAILLAWGTSHFAGTNPASNAKATAWPALLAAKIAAAGTPTASDSNFGSGGGAVTSGVLAYDSTVTLSTGITNWAANLGNVGFRMQSAATIDKTVARLTDTFTVYAQRSVSGTPQFSAGLTGGGSTTTFTLANNGNIQAFTITVPRLANNSFRIAWVSGDVTILGWIPADSLSRVVQVVNGGCPLFTAANLNDANITQLVGLLAPSLTIYGAATNDWLGGTTLSSYKTTTAANIAVAQASGDVVVLTDPPSSATALATQAQYTDAEMGEAYKAGAPVIDLFGSMKGAYPAWNGNGYYFDSVHLNYSFGYPMVAALVGQTVQ